MKSQILKQLKKLYKYEITAEEWQSFIADKDKDMVKECCVHWNDIQDRLKRIHNSFAYTTRIRKYCNYRIGTDVFPFEVVKVISDKVVEIREMDAVNIAPPELISLGGFAGVHDNYTQKWECVSNEQNSLKRIRLSSKGWGLGHYKMGDTPIYFYDYNF